MGEKNNHKELPNQREIHFWGEWDKWKSSETKKRTLLISGIPESGGYISEKNRVGGCLNQGLEKAFGQLYAGTIFLNLDDQASRLAEVLGEAGGNVDLIVYSAGMFVLSKMLEDEKYQYLIDKIGKVNIINPSIGGKSIKAPVMEIFYPKPDKVLANLAKVMDKIETVVLSDKDEFVNSDFVRSKLEAMGLSVQARQGSHAIDAQVVNSLR